MIKGQRKVDLTIETVLQRITDFDIFMHYMPDRFWKLNQVTNSPFHADTHPSFMIGNRNGYLYFVDFAKGIRGGCFDFVKELYHLSSLDEVLRLIDRDFGLGIVSSTNVGEYKKIKAQYKQPEETLGKRYSVIQVVTRKFTNEELKYWNDYHQDISDLRANNVYSISKMYLNRRLYPIKENELRFGYLYGSSWKIYFPFADKKNKWKSNVPITTAYGLSNLSKEANTLITKSMKDYLVCKKLYNNVCHVQNESLIAFSQETVDYIRDNSNEIFYGGDSDVPGKDSSYVITRTFGYKHINPPDRLLPYVKDWADWAKVENLDKLKQHFITKGLII